MIHVIITEELIDRDFVQRYTVGYEQLAEHVLPFTPEWAAPITRIAPEQIRAAARTYATSSPACMLWGSATDAGASNFQTARSLLILRALTGNIDCPGGDVLMVPPRGVHQKSLFMSDDQEGAEFLPPEKVTRSLSFGKYPLERAVHPPTFWQSVVTGEPYRVRGMWIAGCNPLLSQTHPLVIEKALRDHLEFTVVSELFMTPTAALADIVLPAATWLETDDVVNLHKIWCVLARKKVAQIGEVRDDREVILQLAGRLGLASAFPWEDHRANLEWLLRDSGMSFDEFSERGILQGEMRYHKYKENGFATPSGKSEFYNLRRKRPSNTR